MADDLYSEFTKCELKDFLKELQRMLLGNVRMSTFKDQSLQFRSDADIRRKILEVQGCMDERDGFTQFGKKKIVHMQTSSKGFRGKSS